MPSNHGIMSDSRSSIAIDCADRAAYRAAVIFHRKLSRGTTSLQAVVCIAPLLGVFGAAVLLMGALDSPSCNGECAEGISGVFFPIVLSLPVAILACAGVHWLRHQVETFDLEMRTTTCDLLNDLARRRCRS